MANKFDTNVEFDDIEESYTGNPYYSPEAIAERQSQFKQQVQILPSVENLREAGLHKIVPPLLAAGASALMPPATPLFAQIAVPAAVAGSTSSFLGDTPVEALGEALGGALGGGLVKPVGSLLKPVFSKGSSMATKMINKLNPKTATKLGEYLRGTSDPHALQVIKEAATQKSPQTLSKYGSQFLDEGVKYTYPETKSIIAPVASEIMSIPPEKLTLDFIMKSTKKMADEASKVVNAQKAVNSKAFADGLKSLGKRATQKQRKILAINKLKADTEAEGLFNEISELSSLMGNKAVNIQEAIRGGVLNSANFDKFLRGLSSFSVNVGSQDVFKSLTTPESKEEFKKLYE